jgi:hypothetical protein
MPLSPEVEGKPHGREGQLCHTWRGGEIAGKTAMLYMAARKM